MRHLDARIDLDLNCNYKCVYCPKDHAEMGVDRIFPVDTLRRVFPLLNKYCWSVFLSCSGEPTLHPEFEKIMRDDVPELLNKTDVFLVTNGFLLDKDARTAILKSGITRVQISVDTVDPELYSRLCGCAPGAFDRVWRNIEALRMERGNRKYPQIFLTSVAMKSTIGKMAEVCERVVDAGLDGHRIQYMLPHDTAGMKEEDVSGIAETRGALEKCRSILRRGGVYADIPLSFSDRAEAMTRGALLVKNRVEYLAASAGKLLAPLRRPSCRFDGRLIHIYASGEMGFCWSSSVQPGNLFDAIDRGIPLDRFVRDTYIGMRGDSMRSCPAECPYLIGSRGAR